MDVITKSGPCDQRPQQPFQPVCIDLIQRGHHRPQLPGRIALAAKPDDVRFGEVDKQAPAILPEGHARVGQFDEEGVVLCGGGVCGMRLHGAIFRAPGSRPRGDQ